MLGTCSGLNDSGPVGSSISIVGPQLKRIRRCGLIGGLCYLGRVLRFQEPTSFRASSLCLPLENKGVSPQLSAPGPPCLLACLQPRSLAWWSWTHPLHYKPPINSFISKLPWSWCLISAVKKWLRCCFPLRSSIHLPSSLISLPICSRCWTMGCAF